MKRQILKAAMVLSLAVALTITFAVAPTAANSLDSIRVDVPFDFIAGQSILPAGRYTIWHPVGNYNDVIRITSEDGKASVFLSTHAAQSVQYKNEAVVIFHRYGDQYFIFQVWSAGDNMGLETRKSALERQASREMESRKDQPATVGEIGTVIVAEHQSPRSK